MPTAQGAAAHGSGDADHRDDSQAGAERRRGGIPAEDVRGAGDRAGNAVRSARQGDAHGAQDPAGVSNAAGTQPRGEGIPRSGGLTARARVRRRINAPKAPAASSSVEGSGAPTVPAGGSSWMLSMKGEKSPAENGSSPVNDKVNAPVPVENCRECWVQGSVGWVVKVFRVEPPKSTAYCWAPLNAPRPASNQLSV